jgi:hypothetical protein
MLIQEIARAGVVRELLTDNFGNFILQKAMLYGNKTQYIFFIQVSLS